MDDHSYLHALRLIPGVGTRTLDHLLARFGSAEAVWRAPAGEILACEPIGQSVREAIVAGRDRLNPDREWETLARQDIRILPKGDPLFPERLREIADPPALLYVRGTLDWSQLKPAVAIVGSRRFTPYGEQAAGRLAADLARAGVLVVSGLAFGIDAIAHRAAIEAGGETLAVLGSGNDDAHISPRANYELGRRILEHGAIVSEYPPGAEAAKGSFPARNRIIAGLSVGIVIAEAAEGSGSLITARLALDYNRSVFAVPGSIFSPASFGTNQLLREGANPVTCVQDILQEIASTLPAARGSLPRPDAVPQPVPDLSPDEAAVFSALSREPLHVDKIIKASRLETATANSVLGLLEIKGLAQNVGGMNYIKT